MDGIPYLREKRLSNGKKGYYFEIPAHKRIKSFPKNAVSLGNNPFSAKEEALKLYQEYKLLKEKKFTGNPKSLCGLWEVYCIHRKYLTKAPRTQKDYKKCYLKLCSYQNEDGVMFKNIPLDLFDEDSAYSFYESLTKEYDVRTSKYCISLLSILFNFGIYTKKVFPKEEINPFEKLGIKSAPPQNKFIEEDDILKLIQKAYEMNKDKVALAIELNYNICQRPADLLSLRKRNFYYKGEDCFVEIWQQKSRGRQRAIAYIPEHLAKKIMLCEDYIFTNKNGKVYTVNAFGKEFKKVKDSLGIECEFRLLRHSGGTAYVEAGVETNTITIMTGHKNEKIFNQNYKAKSEIAAKRAYLKRENVKKNHSD